MAMLSPQEFFVGSLKEAATEGLTLLLPRDKYEMPFLVAGVAGTKMGIFLRGSYQFHGFECATSDNWKGLLIPGVSIEVESASLFDTQNWLNEPGALIRDGGTLSIAAHIQGSQHFNRVQRVPLVAGLADCLEREAAGFRSWRIVLGEGEKRRELLAIKLPEKAEA